ncbi:MAG: transcriptional regulator [Alphaproteobacteria bacterium]|nr:transcriptional regulator [Alphaproteobacteria bacterium]MCW5742704.1 transcriptional regulator [Alphaproteobacteria bacterium]
MDRTAERLLYALKATGAQTAAALAKRLGVTPVAIRQMLARFQAEGLVGFEDRRTTVGRPKRHWTLSEKGHGRFPDSHAGLTLELLNATEAVFGADGLERLIAHREASTLATYRKRLADAGSLAERVSRLARIRTAEGYMAEARRDGDGMMLIENHCPICAAARRCQSLCRSELQVFQAALGPDVAVERLDHIVTGARRCAYRIRPAAAPA